MLKRYPYWGWLAISLFCWLCTSLYHYSVRMEHKPERLAGLISGDLQQKVTAWNYIKSREGIAERLFDRQLDRQDLNILMGQPFTINAWEDGELVFWNNNRDLASCSGSGGVVNLDVFLKGGSLFYTECDTVETYPRLRIVAVHIPIVRVYPFENDYLKSSWQASSKIPLPAKVSDTPQQGYYPVEYARDSPVFYVGFDERELREGSVPDAWLSVMTIITLILSFLWFQFIALYLSKHKGSVAGILFVVFVAVAGRIMVYYAGLPFQFEEVRLFSPQLYASSRMLPSLGDLLINITLLSWVWLFIFTQARYRTFSHGISNVFLRYLLGTLFVIAITGYTFYAIYVIRSIVVDSMITFEVSDFFATDIYTYIGLAVVMMIAASLAITLHVVNTQFTHFFGSRYVKYPLILIVGTLMVYLFGADEGSSFSYFYYVLGWLILTIALLDLDELKINRNLLAPHMIFWMFFLCVSVTGLLYYFNYEKERVTRELYAEKLLRQRDPVTQYLFPDLVINIQQDQVLKDFFRRPSPRLRELLDERFEGIYMSGHLSRYQSAVSLFSPEGKGVFNADTVGFEEMQRRVARFSQVSGHLYFQENAADDLSYLARIPVSTDGDTLSGYVFITMKLKKTNHETLYPALLQPGSINRKEKDGNYFYAVYNNGTLVYQSGNYSFPLQTGESVPGYYFEDKNGVSELLYHTDSQRSVIVVYRYDFWLRIITLFSYLIGTLLLLLLISLSFRLVFLYVIIGKQVFALGYMSLRKRIHYAMLGVVLVSFLVIGLTTITFFNNQYRKTKQDHLQHVTQIVENAVRQYLPANQYADDADEFGELAKRPEFGYFIANLAGDLRIDINIYNVRGRLASSSQNAIYEKKLLAELMSASAYQDLVKRNRSVLIRQEQIGTLSYLSGYVPARNERGDVLGYIHVPYFASQDELNSQVSSILIALVNLYAFIFMVSSILAVVITNSLTRSLHMIIEKFKHLNLRRNELIDWPYEDEIGLLVNEYNKMVRKVETHALMLAQNERESAWREMARQVAHEIKNPLTPMKLNIQYLQQALRLNLPNTQELASRITVSLIEQIDNLSYIATEFSNFAQMPAVVPERLELNESLKRAVELYAHEHTVSVRFARVDPAAHIFFDKSQFLRVCNNLLHNAVQSIPEGRQGVVSVFAELQGDHVILAFRDNGIGICEEVKGNIFKPYFTTKTSGTGLGLAMTKKVIEFWKGSIWFETELNKGTVFFIRLPLALPGAEFAGFGPEPGSGASDPAPGEE